jgi:hypothetical protein
MKQDSRLTGQLPQLVKLEEKVQQMVEYCSNNPSWFVETHHKRIQKQVKPSASSDSTMTTIVDVEPATTTTTIENGPVSEQSVAAGGCDVETAATIVLGDTGAQKEEEEIVAAPMATSDESTKQHDSGIDVSMPQQCNSIATQQEETTSDAQHNGTMEETTTTAEYVNGEGKEQQAPVKSPVQQNGIVMESSEHSESKEASDRHQVPPPLDSGVFEWSSTMNGGGVIDDSEHHLIPNGNKHNNNNSSNGHLLKNGYIPPNNNNKHHPNPHSHHMMLPKMGSSAVVKKDKRKQQRGAKTNHNYNNNNNAKEGSRHLEKEEEEATMDSGFNDHRVEADRPLISNNS